MIWVVPVLDAAVREITHLGRRPLYELQADGAAKLSHLYMSNSVDQTYFCICNQDMGTWGIILFSTDVSDTILAS